MRLARGQTEQGDGGARQVLRGLGPPGQRGGEDPFVWTTAGDPTEGHSSISFDEWPQEGITYVECPGDFCGVWLYLNDGLITEIVEQYTP